MLPKIVLTDIDGVWTDGGMYYDQTGNEFKKFNTYDSAGIIFLKLMKIPVGIITGEETEIVKNRVQKLNVDYLFMAAKNKLLIVQELCEKLGIKMKDVAYIGDDINDIKLLENCGYSAVPVNAPEYVKKYAKSIVNCKGGDGAFRIFVEEILESNHVFEKCLELYLNTQENGYSFI